MSQDFQHDKQPPVPAARALQHKAVGERAADAVPPAVLDVLRSPGQALDTASRAFFEPRFGHDFGTVRVHTDERASRSVIELGALAYTAGNHMAFAQSRFAPDSTEGQALLAHELTHAVQQDLRSPTVLQNEPDAAAEAQASDISARVLRNAPISGPWVRSPPAVRPAKARAGDGVARQPVLDPERALAREQAAGEVEHSVGENRWILYNFGVADTAPKPEHRRALTILARDWWPVHRTHVRNAKVHVSGHASRTGRHKDNARLARERAESVKAFLVQCAIADKDILTDSFGDEQPFGLDPEDPHGLAVDRRVEIFLEGESEAFEQQETPLKPAFRPAPSPRELGSLHPVLPESIRPERNTVPDAQKDAAKEAAAHVTSEMTEGMGVLGRASIPYALYLSLKMQVEVIESINRAQRSGEREAARKAAAYVMVSIAKNVAIPEVAQRDGWGWEEGAEWIKTLAEVRREVESKRDECKRMRSLGGTALASVRKSEAFGRRFQEAATITDALETLSRMNREDGLNAVYEAICGNHKIEAHLTW